MALSSKRAEMIASYEIDKDEIGLQKLVDDLCLEEATERNLLIIQYALEGRFSNFDRYYVCPSAALLVVLQAAGYTNMLRKNKEEDYCRYDHSFAAKTKNSDSSEVRKASFLHSSVQPPKSLLNIDDEEKQPGQVETITFKYLTV